jgi:hypothetical protein
LGRGRDGSDFYAAKLAHSPKHAHKRALVLTARKVVRLGDALLRSEEAEATD